MAIVHSKVSAKTDTLDTALVQPSDWNDDHTWTTAKVDIDALGIDAGTIDGHDSAYFATSAHDHTSLNDLDGIVFEKASGTGIKIDTATPDWPWRDLYGNIYVKDSAAGNNPSFVTYKGNINQWRFDEDDVCYLEFPVPHDYVPGTDLYIHTHWSNATSTTGNAVWIFEITYATVADPFGTNIVTSATTAATATAYDHIVSEVIFTGATETAALIDRDVISVDGVFLVRVKYDSTSTLTNLPFLHFVDMHYQTNIINTKNRSYPFYT